MMPMTIHGTIGTGLRIAIAFRAAPRANARNTNTETMFPFCTSGSFDSAPQGRDDFFRRESMRVAFRQHARRKRFQPPRVLRRRPRLGPAGTHERTHSPPSLEDAVAFELAVNAGHRVRVDLELH